MLTDIPAGWQSPDSNFLAKAKAKALEALNCTGGRPASVRLAKFYDPEGNYAGASFTQLPPVSPNEFTASDLQAVTLMSVFIGPRATRRLLQDASPVLEMLQRVPDIQLRNASQAELLVMAELHEEIKGILGKPGAMKPDPWVTASKLCARKRPGLFPARDNMVRDYLRLTEYENYEVDWLTYRYLTRDEQITTAIDAAANATQTYAAANNMNVVLDHPQLRLLDAALWTYARGVA